METLQVREFNTNEIKHLKMNGLGTELNPFVPVQDVNIQDQTSENISIFLGNHLATDLSLTSDLSQDQEIFQVDSPSGAPTAGQFMCIKDGVRFEQAEIIGVAGAGGTLYNVQVSMPISYPFTTNSSVCIQEVNMAVNGSSTPVDFFISPGNLDAGVQWDITRMIISMTHNSAGDDGKFGGINALTNGTFFRVNNGIIKNLFNAKTNEDFRVEGYDLVYPDRSGGGGDFATAARITFSGQDKRGVTLRLNADNSDMFFARVRDDLTGLSTFRVKIQGHVVE